MKAMLRTTWPVLLAASLAAYGCDAIFGDDYEVRFQTDAEEYPATIFAEIGMTIENRGDNVVYYRCAGDLFIERFVDGDLDDTFGALPNCASLGPTPIEAGESENRTLQLDENVVKWIDESPNPAESTYRLRLELFEDTAFERELDADDQRSNTFTLLLPQPE